MLLGEVPAAGPAVEGLAAMFLFLAFIICIGLQKAWRATIGWVFVELANKIAAVRLPGILGGGRLFGPVVDFLRGVNSSVEHALGAAALKSEAGATWLWSMIAHQVTWMSRELRALAVAVEHRFEHVGGVAITDVTKLTKALSRATLHTLLHPFAVALQQLAVAEHALTRRVGRLEHAIADVLPHAIPGVIPRIGRLEREWDSVEHRVGRLERLLAPAAIVALIGATIFKLLPRFIRCPSFARWGNKLGCGGFSLFADLLEATFIGFAVADLCDFAAAAGWTAHELSPLLAELVVVEDALIGCHGADKPPDLPLPALTLPPVTLGLQLAA